MMKCGGNTWRKKRWENNTVTYLPVRLRFGSVIAFIGLLQLVTTDNYSSIPYSRTLQITVALFDSSECVLFSPVVAW
jgi:hypothetical protein